MRYATYFPNEGKLALYQHHRNRPHTVLEVIEHIQDNGHAAIYARTNWKQKAVLIKRYKPCPPAPQVKPTKPVLTDEQFLATFPKGMHAAILATAKRNKAGIQDIFDNAVNKEGGLVTLNEGWEVHGGFSAFGESTIKDCLPYFKFIARAKE